VLVRPSQRTLGECLDEWLEVQRRVRKPPTAGGYANIVHSWVTPHIGHVRLADLGRRVFVKLFDLLRREGGRPTRAARVAAAYGTKPVGSPLGPRTIQSVHVLLRSALSPAVYLAKELLRGTYLAANALEVRRRFVAFDDHCTSSELPELERLARTISRWETPILRWHHTLLTNAAAEGTNLVIKNIKRLGFGFGTVRFFV
jgi:Transposase